MENMNTKIDLSALIELIFIMSLFVGVYFLGNTGQLKLLINPRYDVLVFVSLLILLIFLVFLFSKLFVESNNKSGKVLFDKKYLLFLLIIILLIVFKLTPNFDTYFAAASGLKSFNVIDTKQGDQYNSSDVSADQLIQEETILPKDMNKGLNDDTPKKEIVFTEESYFNLLNDIHENIDKYIDKSVIIKGFIYHLPDLDPNYLVIARFLMWCCAADASVVGFVCSKNEIQYDFKKNDWYEIEAFIKKETLNINNQQKILPVLLIKKYKKIDRMDNPYIYPIYY